MKRFLGYPEDGVLEFNDKKSCGLWLMAVGIVMLLSTILGGKQMISMPIFLIGYVLCFFAINMNKRLIKRLSDGPSIAFQDKVANYSIGLLFILMSLINGPFFASENWRIIWSGALLATALHFFPYYFVHGKSMIWLGVLCSLNIGVSYFLSSVPFVYFALGDGVLKLVFGVYLLCFSKPTTNQC